ncbi:MAG: cytochrome c3 family protein [Candidatus Krumholzibacteria bacterium]|nr:cytochrome c3 family protein [Candidatus Krumholzibacteria bacterium]
MFNRTERAIAAVVLAACAAAVVVSIWPQPTEPPAKIWFAAQGGDLIFDHAFHATMVECRDCHHNSPAAEEQGRRVEMNCRACHYYDPAVKVTTADPHPRAIGASCTDCHDHLGAELSRCDACHLHLGYAFIASARYKQPFPQFVVFPEDDPVAVDSPGTVVFAHAYHSTIGQCLRCHHDYDPAATGVRPGEKNCRRCHHDASVVPAEGEMPHALFVGDNCLYACHTDLGGTMADCETCHLAPGTDPSPWLEQVLPRPPRRVVYETDAGEVLFDHLLHHYDYARIACTACHHEPQVRPGLEDLATSKDCRACHYEREHLVPAYSGDGIHPHYIGNSCTSCHAVDNCALCHRE